MDLLGAPESFAVDYHFSFLPSSFGAAFYLLEVSKASFSHLYLSQSAASCDLNLSLST